MKAVSLAEKRESSKGSLMTLKKKNSASLEKGTGHGADRKHAALTEELPSSEQVAQRAYERYLERGCGPGEDVSDWLQAEQELRGMEANHEPVSDVV